MRLKSFRAYIIRNLWKDKRCLEHMIATTAQVKAANTVFSTQIWAFPVPSRLLGYYLEN